MLVTTDGGKYWNIAGVEEQELRVEGIELRVYPNPFLQSTTIRLEGSSQGVKELRIYDLAGKVIKSFSLNPYDLSLTTVVVSDGTDTEGREVRNGIYFLKFKVQSSKFKVQKESISKLIKLK
ncbi:MAG: T9SS type A sorting domain-containing protein [Candidatus Stahlbacteria bacterium]|nr:T9SS type A sorting domain-containing protein [Candidatus Stahlbacteria bacterium]